MDFTTFTGRAVNETERSVMGDRYMVVSTGAAVKDREGRGLTHPQQEGFFHSLCKTTGPDLGIKNLHWVPIVL